MSDGWIILQLVYSYACLKSRARLCQTSSDFSGRASAEGLQMRYITGARALRRWRSALKTARRPHVNSWTRGRRDVERPIVWFA